MTGSCLMSKSLLKLHLVCAVFDLKAQPDTLAHWGLIDISVVTLSVLQEERYDWKSHKNDSAQELNEERGLSGSGRAFWPPITDRVTPSVEHMLTRGPLPHCLSAELHRASPYHLTYSKGGNSRRKRRLGHAVGNPLPAWAPPDRCTPTPPTSPPPLSSLPLVFSNLHAGQNTRLLPPCQDQSREAKNPGCSRLKPRAASEQQRGREESLAIANAPASVLAGGDLPVDLSMTSLFGLLQSAPSFSPLETASDLQQYSSSKSGHSEVEKDRGSSPSEPGAPECDRHVYKSVLEGGDIPLQGLRALNKRHGSSSSSKVVSRQSLGRLRASLQSVPAPGSGGPEWGWMRRDDKQSSAFHNPGQTWVR
ncbi:hypothetical protein INR49_009677 [Caranx melampygus]|nr:hypothetical protein INR49_009677 [Caranx melampygus]